MDGSSLSLILIPIVIPLVLFIGIALPYIADHFAQRRPPARQGAGRYACGHGS